MEVRPGAIASMSFQLDSSGAWIDLAEPPGSNVDQQHNVVPLENFERQIHDDTGSSLALSLPSSRLQEVAAERVATRRMESELSAALAARSFVNGIVIGNILQQSQPKHPDYSSDGKHSPNIEGKTYGKGKDSHLSPSKAKDHHRLTVGKAGVAFRAVGDRPRSLSVQEGIGTRSSSSSPHRINSPRRSNSPIRSAPSSPSPDKDRKYTPKGHNQFGHKLSLASQESVRLKNFDARTRKKRSEDSSNGGASDELYGDETYPHIVTEFDELHYDDEILEVAPLPTTTQEIAVSTQALTEMSHFTESNQNACFGGWPSLANDNLCGFEILGGQHLGGLHLEAELPYALAGLFGFQQYQAQPHGAQVKTPHTPADALSYATIGRDIHTDYSQHFMYGTETTAYPNVMDYGGVRSGVEDHLQHIPTTCSSVGRIEDSFEFEEPPQNSVPVEHSAPVPPTPPTESDMPRKVRESVKMPKLQLPVISAKSKQKPLTARAETQRVAVSPVQQLDSSSNEEKHSSSSSPGRRRRVPPINTQQTHTDEDVYIYHLSARPAVPLASRQPIGESAVEGDLDHSTSNVGGNVEVNVEVPDPLAEPDRVAMARSHSNKLLTNLNRPSMGDYGFRRQKPQSRPGGLIGSARVSREASNSSRKHLAPLNPRLRALMTSDQKVVMSDSKGTLATVSTRVGGSSQDSTTVLPKAGKVGGLSPLDAAKQAHWKCHRERQWNSSFATMEGQGIPDLFNSDRTPPKDQKGDNRATSAPVVRHVSSEAAQLSWTQSQELAAHWAISLAVNPVRPISVPSVSSVVPGKNQMADMLSKVPKRDISQDYIEWHGSPLHRAFIASLLEQRENQQDPEAGEAGMALFAIEDQLERTYTELRDLLEERINGISQLSESAWMIRVEFLLDVLLDEMQIPDQWRQAAPRENLSEADALTEHASEILAFRDTTVRIIGGLVDRDRVQAARNQHNLGLDEGDDAESQHLGQISHALNLGISTWCRHFGHLAQLTCGQLAGETRNSMASLHQRRETSGQQAIFLWCGQDAQQSLQGTQTQPESVSSKSQTWPTAEMPNLGNVPQTPCTPGSRLPGFRTQERASRSATRGLRSVLRGGIGAAGQYVTSKQVSPRVNDLFGHQ